MTLPGSVVRYLRTLAAIEREAALADDTPPWLVGLLGAVDPADLADLIGDRCPTCGNNTHSVHADRLTNDPIDKWVKDSQAYMLGRPLTDREKQLLAEVRTIT